MRIAYLLPVVSHYRFRKRIDSLEKLGVKPTILSFERDLYPGKPFKSGYVSLGKIEHKKYFKRLFSFPRVLFRIRKEIKHVDVCYAFGMDMLFLAWIAFLWQGKNKKIVYEVGDIREIFIGDSFKSRFFRWMERFLLTKTHLLVITSEAYANSYYKKIQNMKDIHYHVIENKLDVDLKQGNNLHLNDNDSIIIGYFGVLRCSRSWEILKTVAKKGEGRIKVYLRGIANNVDNLINEANETQFVEYGGPYIAPDELPGMYSKVDIVWACYPYQGKQVGNWLWARTNRFYESCLFKKPIITHLGTEEARVVESLNIGFGIDLANIDSAVESILNIDYKDIKLWKGNANKISKDVYLYKDEHKKLVELIIGT